MECVNLPSKTLDPNNPKISDTVPRSESYGVRPSAGISEGSLCEIESKTGCPYAISKDGWAYTSVDGVLFKGP